MATRIASKPRPAKLPAAAPVVEETLPPIDAASAPEGAIGTDVDQHWKEWDNPVLVELPGAPKVVVDAKSTASAWQKYCKVAGVRGSDHQPKFKRPGPDCLVNVFGVVCDENGFHKFADLKKPDNGIRDWSLEDNGLEIEEEVT